jgi:DNA-binding FadR family transcriptional regulator
MSRHLDSIEAFLTGRQLERTLLFGDAPPGGDGKRGATIARQIFADVVGRGWPVDELLGSEGDLMEKYDVSRAVLREAIRLLEFHRIVRTRRGPGGGILVAAPDVGATTSAIAVYLESRKITPEQLFEVRQAVELAVVELAANRFDAHAIESLQKSLREEQAESPEAVMSFSHALHLRIAELTGNGAVELFLHVLTRLTAQHARLVDGDLPLTYEEGAARVHRAHAAIVEAIVAGDSDLARRRMQRHLEAITPMMG